MSPVRNSGKVATNGGRFTQISNGMSPMAQKSVVKNLILWLLAIFLALCAAGFFIPVSGEWVDPLVSRLLSRELGIGVRCVNARIVRWSKVYFNQMTVGVKPEEMLLESGSGEIYLHTPPFLIFRLNDIRFTQHIGSYGFIASLPIAKGLQGELTIQRFTAGLSGQKEKGFLHLFECDSDHFKLKGGVKWGGGRVMKAHLYLSLSPEKTKKLPKEILRRMIPREKGWVAVRIVYGQNKLVLAGPNGPLFQAKWGGLIF